MNSSNSFNQFGPVLGFILMLGCAPKAAITTRVPDENETARQEAPVSSNQTPASEEVFTFVEQMPDFPGGQSTMNDFIAKNMLYPQEARDNNEEGKVVVQFVVTKEGQIRDANVVKSVSPTIDKEALRVVSIMPRWQPGKQNGRPVNVRYMLPIMFALN